jgi:hypothetical protein
MSMKDTADVAAGDQLGALIRDIASSPVTSWEGLIKEESAIGQWLVRWQQTTEWRGCRHLGPGVSRWGVLERPGVVACLACADTLTASVPADRCDACMARTEDFWPLTTYMAPTMVVMGNVCDQCHAQAIGEV